MSITLCKTASVTAVARHVDSQKASRMARLIGARPRVAIDLAGFPDLPFGRPAARSDFGWGSRFFREFHSNLNERRILRSITDCIHDAKPRYVICDITIMTNRHSTSYRWELTSSRSNDPANDNQGLTRPPAQVRRPVGFNKYVGLFEGA
jgi:hypothetical protein